MALGGLAIGAWFVLDPSRPAEVDHSIADGASAFKEESLSEDSNITQTSKSVIAVATVRDHSPNSEFGWLSAGVTEEMRRQISAWKHYEVLHRSQSDLITHDLDEIPAWQPPQAI